MILALLPLKFTVMFWQSAVGGVTSRTVTVAVQVAVFPLPSATVNVTVLDPRFEQVKLLWETDCAVAVPQLSVEPLLICEAVILALLPLKFTVMFWHTAVGGVTSFTVTVALHEACWLLLPVIVKVTVAGPRFEQFSTVGDTLRLAIPPKAVEPPSTSAAEIVTVPFAPRFLEIFWHTAFGNWLFSTVTWAVQVEVFPLASGTVNVTVFWPKLASVNAFGLTVRVPRPQLSEEPLFTCAAVKAAFPLPFNCSTTSRQRAVGAVLSRMVTVPVQVEVLPLPSLTVKITVLGPTFEQLKLLWETDCGVGVPQLSVEPLLSCEAVMVALLPLKFTVMFWQRAVGGVLSRTVTVAVQVAVLPLPSATVNVTVLGPKCAQVKLLWETDCAVAVPQLSVEPLLSCEAVMFALFPLKFTVMFWQRAVGAVMSRTVTVAVQVAVFPLPSATVNVTTFAPRFEQVKLLWETDCAVAVPQLSVELLLICEAVMLALLPLKFTVMFWQRAVGGVLS